MKGSQLPTTTYAEANVITKSIPPYRSFNCSTPCPKTFCKCLRPLLRSIYRQGGAPAPHFAAIHTQAGLACSLLRCCPKVREMLI